MKFAFTDEQEQLREIARRFLGNHSTSKDVRDAAASEQGWDPEIWARVGGELGWTALAIPESYGGFGFSLVEVSAVMEEMGRHLFCSPFLSSIGLAANVVLLGGTDAQKETLLPTLASAEQTATLAWMGESGDWSGGGGPCLFRKNDQGYHLEGAYRYVLDGHSADHLIVAARDEADELALFLLAADSEGISRRGRQTMDRTRRFADIDLAGVSVSADAMLCCGDAAEQALKTTLDIGRSLLAAEQVGVAQACLDEAVEYAKVREQFGTPIGKFQAVKHMCADMMLQVESARSAAYFAGWSAAYDPEGFAEAALTAQAYCAEACFDCASQSVQIHGGIGFTWEHDAHLYLKRAKANEELFGSPAEHRQRYAGEILGL